MNGMAAKNMSMAADRQENRLTQCFEEILRLSADLLTQQQLKTIKVDSKVTSGFSKTQQKVLGDRISQFHSILDSLDVSLQETAEYVDAVTQNAARVKKQRQEEQYEQERRREEQKRLEQQKLEQQKLEQQKLEQQKLEQQKLEQQKLEQERYSAKNTPMDMLTNFDAEVPAAVSQATQPFNTEFADLNGMDLSMFDTMDNQVGFGGLQSTSGPGEKKDPEMNFNDTNVAPSSVAVPESNPNSYLTLNDFNDLGIDWNAANENNELNLEDFNM